MRARWFLLGAILLTAGGCGDDDDGGADDAAGAAGTGARAGGAGTGGAIGGRGGAGASAGAGQGGASAGTGQGGASAGRAGSSAGGSGSGGLADASAGDSGRGGGAAAGEGGASGGGNGGAGGATADLSDGEILKVLDTANLGEIEQGEIATDRAQAEEVRDYAETMIVDHSAAREKGDMLAKSNDITLEANPIAQRLQAKSDAIVARLTSADSGEFDAIYMQSQVEVHEAVLELLDTTLIPDADTPEVEAFVTQIRAAVAEHLEMAEDVLDSLE
jgi:putative membrane protein